MLVEKCEREESNQDMYAVRCRCVGRGRFSVELAEVKGLKSLLRIDFCVP